MTDNKTGEPLDSIKKEVQDIKDMGVRVISVGIISVHQNMKELVAMSTSEEYVILYHDNVVVDKVGEQVLKKIHGYDIFDRYNQYFVTPYFIFVRDILSYLVLLGLHFAMCLQPSTLHLTTLEWVIMCFFIGRLWIEIYQAGMEKKWSDTMKSTSRYNGKIQRGMSQLRNGGKSLEGSNDEIDGEKGKIRGVLFNMISRYFSDWWNVLDFVTVAVYIVILILRSITLVEHASVPHNRLLAVAGYLYGLNTMILTLRIFGHIMESTDSTGSIQIAFFQIMGAVLVIFWQFIAAILAFSLAITKVYVAEMSYNTVRNSSSHGFCKSGEDGISCWLGSATHLIWSLLGVPSTEPMASSDPASDVLAKLLYGSFLIMAVVMIMNMMIALLSNTYQKVQDNAFYEWSYRKATTIRTYQKYHPVPVPFNIISFAAICIWCICSRSYKGVRKLLHRRMKHACKSKPLHDYGDHDSFFDSLVSYLEVIYFAAHGYSLPMADSSKIDHVLKETDGNRKIIGHIANKVFKYDKKESRELFKGLTTVWDTNGISIKGHELTYISCQCSQCNEANRPIKNHGARFSKQLSPKWPGFEVLIQESGERRFIAIGVVTDTHNCHKFPGSEGNSAGYHIFDDGKIFDINNQKNGRKCEDAMVYRGDMIGCKILHDRPSRDNTLTVSFTLNGRVIGEGSVKNESGTTAFYPFVGMAWDGISLLFMMCSSHHNEVVDEIYQDRLVGDGEDKQPVLGDVLSKVYANERLLIDIQGRLCHTTMVCQEALDNHSMLDDTLRTLQGISDDRLRCAEKTIEQLLLRVGHNEDREQQALSDIFSKPEKLEQKVDQALHLSSISSL